MGTPCRASLLHPQLHTKLSANCTKTVSTRGKGLKGKRIKGKGIKALPRGGRQESRSDCQASPCRESLIAHPPRCRTSRRRDSRARSQNWLQLGPQLHLNCSLHTSPMSTHTHCPTYRTNPRHWVENYPLLLSSFYIFPWDNPCMDSYHRNSPALWRGIDLYKRVSSFPPWLHIPTLPLLANATLYNAGSLNLYTWILPYIYLHCTRSIASVPLSATAHSQNATHHASLSLPPDNVPHIS